jgi:(1->4)-alpha-D-glucan 1-alpha-D-glucosylmutase
MTPQEICEALLARVAEQVAGRRLPESTYRLQFHKGFTFADATALVPFLHALGISHCYASPYLKARPGSMHGYDIINHGQLNPEIGTQETYDHWVNALHEQGMGQILDMVPNHMGIIGNDNPWWNDVLENGVASTHAATFDIGWYASPRPQLRGRLLLPVLGDPYGKVLEAGQLRLEFAAGAFSITYFDHRFPVDPGSIAHILGQRADELEQAFAADPEALVEYQSILTAVKHLPSRSETDAEKVAERQREKEVIKRRLAVLTEQHGTARLFLDEIVASYNGTPGEPRSFDLLDELLDDQAYRLSYWRVASDEINYRRFFDVNELAALNMERPEVFAVAHELVLRLARAGQVDGLRIDHPDGLYDPRQYLQRLQQHFVLGCARQIYEAAPELHEHSWEEIGAILEARLEAITAADPRYRPLYVVVEKILVDSETLRPDWPTHGTSGYDFLAAVNGLSVARDNAKAFTQLYRDWIQDDERYAELAYRRKVLILQVSLSSELQLLTDRLDRLAQKNRWSRDFTFNSLRAALGLVIAQFPAYRSYIDDAGPSEEDRRNVVAAVRRARLRNPALSTSLFNFLRDMLLLHYPDSADDQDREEQRQFVGKFQQVTGPVMAKGVEDTAFYIYNRLLALNEVGGGPQRFGTSPADLHHFLQDRQTNWPRALSATSTHDTKRSEDVRARLAVLSEMPDEWRAALERWSKANSGHRIALEEDQQAPDANEEYFFYQTLLGAWPLDDLDAAKHAEFVGRIQACMEKSLHEAKVHTSWINPDQAYDEAIARFVATVLDRDQNRSFLDDFLAFQKRVSHFGMFNSLAQVLLKIAAPGVPDIYQGQELWDFSLVDPDNRRPVDYALRQRLLEALQQRHAAGDLPALARELVETRGDGRIKLYTTMQALHVRRQHPGLLSEGTYVPLESSGAKNAHVFAFLRESAGRAALLVVPRLVVQLTEGRELAPTGADVWRDTVANLPDEHAGRRWRNIYTGETHQGKSLALAAVLSNFPVALLVDEAAEQHS